LRFLSRIDDISAHGNAPNLQIPVIARAAGPWQSTSTIWRECAHILTLARLAGEGGAKRRVGELFLAERSDAYFFYPFRSVTAQGNICGALRRRVDALSRPCRGTLSRQAGEREASGGVGGEGIAQRNAGGLPRRYAPRNDES
jgi:hypothetical protein